MSKRRNSPKKNTSPEKDSVPEFRPDDDDDEVHDETYREYHERSDQEGCDDLDAKITSSNWRSNRNWFGG
ncbi:hypothetical protein HRR99_17945 [Agrobacterium vaccinii]|uniref:hypothetical protein n=1 Tax=Agrobacterium vaccinii TaxID=2735528 RepID=UPI001E314F54|nr:hypothetical protein [Agrobacterium vaccinii]UHS63459.1 hypothetical protein HRR99_17945 [Agrobacterium vaccinii]